MTRLYLYVLPGCGLHDGFPRVRAAGCTPVGASGEGGPRLPARSTTFAHVPDSSLKLRDRMIDQALDMLAGTFMEDTQ